MNRSNNFVLDPSCLDETSSPTACGDCNGNIHELDGAIIRSTSGCCSYVTVSSSCSLEFAFGCNVMSMVITVF
ncbi:MAG: hypothetical protein U0T36_07535 [Saprospiraceae bacterium]